MTPIAEGPIAEPAGSRSAAAGIHSCSYFCTRPECIRAQRDELREEAAKMRRMWLDVQSGLQEEMIENIGLRKQVAALEQDAYRHFDSGWAMCAARANRYDLLYDMGATAYAQERFVDMKD